MWTKGEKNFEKRVKSTWNCQRGSGYNLLLIVPQSNDVVLIKVIEFLRFNLWFELQSWVYCLIEGQIICVDHKNDSKDGGIGIILNCSFVL